MERTKRGPALARTGPLDNPTIPRPESTAPAAPAVGGSGLLYRWSDARKSNAHETEAAFIAEMAAAGLLTPDPIIADGALRRVHIEGDRPGSRNGWYVLHPDPPVSGAFGCWRRGISGTWSAVEPARLSREDREILRRRVEEARATRLLEQTRQHADAARRAAYLWRCATLAPADHAYLARKRVTPGTARIDRGGRLVLPVVDLDGALHSLQFIGPDGEKRLLTGGRKQGHVIPVAGRIPGASRVLICEGWATGRTLAEMEPSALILAAIDAGNLELVAVAVRRRWPDAPIVVCCDADPVGIGKGRAAAIATGGTLAIPDFPAGVPGTDWNDLAAAMPRKEAA